MLARSGQPLPGRASASPVARLGYRSRMCGLAGIVTLDGLAPSPDVVQHMVGRLAHRGPDDDGFFSDEHVALGHRRLSILDPTPAGAQPMRRGDTWLVHNGEIYNYLELAKELREAGCVLVTETDTEVILAAYQAWGVDAIRRFNGMWAFALWDATRKRLVLSRDRMGIKPLYLRRTSRSLVFASEVSTLAETWPVDPTDGWRPAPDLAVVRDFFVSGEVDHSERTFVDGVTSLPAAHNLIVERDRFTFQRYWPAPPLADDDRPFVRGRDAVRDAELVEEFGAAFDRSVQLHLRSDVPIGTCLSGGLDSSSIVLTASHVLAGINGNGRRIVPFTSNSLDLRFTRAIREKASMSPVTRRWWRPLRGCRLSIRHREPAVYWMPYCQRSARRVNPSVGHRSSRNTQSWRPHTRPG